MKNLIAFLFSLFLSLPAMAVPAQPGIWKTVTLSNGQQIKVELCGDEFFSFWKSESGKKYVNRGVYYEEVSSEHVTRLSLQHRAIAESQIAERRAKSKAMHKAGSSYEGKKKGIVILVEFNDRKFSQEDAQNYYDRFSNERGFAVGDGKGSVRDYFRDQSNGKLDIEFDVVGPVELPQSYAYYGKATEEDNDDYVRLYEFVSGAIGQVASKVTWSDYDWDGDGYVDQVYFIYAGQGQADGGDADTIWPHEFSLTGLAQWGGGKGPISLGGVRLDTYACSNEVNRYWKACGIGTMCHEFSHCLGLPDMYDASYSGQVYGMGSWDLMHQGSYNMSGTCPPNFTSWERMAIGWQQPIVLDEDVAIEGMEPLTKHGNTYIIYNQGHKDEYYLLENRQNTGWDQSIAGAGMLVLHIDYDAYIFGPYFRGPNTIQGGNDHARVTIIHADNKSTEYDEKNDPYPFGNVNSLANNTTPSATTYNANTDGKFLMNIKIANIKQNADGTMSFEFGNPMDESVLLRETFDNCNGTGANDGNWMTFRTGSGTFTPDNDASLWTYTYAGAGYHCARFGQTASTASVTTPAVEFTGKATMTFRAAPYAKEGNMVLELKSDNEDITFTPSTFQLVEKEWTDCTVEITGKGEGSVVFTPDCRLYLDDIIIKSTSSPAPSFVRGDANDDGTVTVTDIVATANHILGSTPDVFNSKAADSNQDDQITVTDIVYDAQYILNGEFPDLTLSKSSKVKAAK